ncbi:MFS general substrate transporter [Whalleya microplaca]|nr:MFS general substrate transporter [Whalleya microplaca]
MATDVNQHEMTKASLYSETPREQSDGIVRELGQLPDPDNPSNPVDKAAMASVQNRLSQRRNSDAIVSWDGNDDPENPYNWPAWRTNTYAALLSLLAFLIPLASSIIAPAVPDIMLEFGSDSPVLAAFVVSIYVLGRKIGPLLFAPLSEIYGRVMTYHVSNLGFVAFHVACALAPSLGSLIAFRFLAGFFGSCPPTNGGASIADMVPQQRRGVFMAGFAICPVSGPVVGPVAGGFLATAKGWRWVFWLVTIAGGFLSIAMLFLARETYAPVILQRKVNRLRQQTGKPYLRHSLDTGPSPATRLKQSFVRPTKFLIFSPIGAMSAVYMTVVYGYLYIMFSSITQVFEQTYGFTPNLAGLAFLGLGVGSTIGIAIVSLTSDRQVKRQMEASGGSAKPEVRVQAVPIGGILLPAGLFIYGWTAEYKVHWIVPILGMALVGIGNIIIFMSIILYLIDTFTIYAASALAANTVIRSLGGAFLPLAGLSLFASLGVGWGNSLLGFIAVGFLPVSFLFLRYGETLRRRYEIKDL